jgi:predicted ABC-type ATPase
VAASRPLIVVLAGPNGAGKSTAAPSLLRDALAVEQFVNADTIARGLSEFRPEQAAVAAGRIMLARLDTLARERASFAFETTLASRTFAPWLRARQSAGYHVHIAFLSLPDAETALARVHDRARLGGHNVPEDAIPAATRTGCATSSAFIMTYLTPGDCGTVMRPEARA